MTDKYKRDELGNRMKVYEHVANRTFMTRPLRKLSGTGYIPCENCNTKELIENINKERNDKLPKFSVRI